MKLGSTYSKIYALQLFVVSKALLLSSISRGPILPQRHPSETENDFCVPAYVDRRRIISSTLSTIGALAVPDLSFGSDTVNVCPPQKKVLEAQSQLDLAVQASSVQAWKDAIEISESKLLDETKLLSYFDDCASITKETPERKQLRIDALEAVARLRAELSRGNLTTDDAMAVMKFGTDARTAIDAYFGI